VAWWRCLPASAASHHPAARAAVRILSLAPILLCLLLAAGCETVGTRQGDDATGELRHRNWWNYYRRGEALAMKGDVRHAREDFERALGLRSGAKFGNDTDTWRVRTYGMHFIEGYFPNRELGVCLYRLGDTDKAITRLEKSLEQAPSGRAKRYLNLARRKRLAAAPPPEPRIELSAAAGAVWTGERTRRLSGVASGPARISRLAIGDSTEFIELAEERCAFDKEVRLREGSNTVAVVATDLLGRSVTLHTEWMADWQPPLATVQRVVPDGAGWLVTAVCRDDNALKSVSLEGNQLQLDDRRSAKIQTRVTDGKELVLTAEDLAGNRLRMVLSRDLAREVSGLESGALPVCAVGARADGLPPSMKLAMANRTVRVFDEEYFLDGEVRDGGGLAVVAICGENQLDPADRGAVRAHFARRLPLAVGTNRFDVVATDRAGNTSEKTVTVIRCEPEYLDAEFRLKIGVPPLRGDDGSGMTEHIKRLLEDELLVEPVRFHLLERDEGWEFILREQQLSLSDLADRGRALRIGKMLPAELLFLGVVMKHDVGLTVRVEAVDTTRGRPLVAEDVYSENMAEDLAYQVSGLVLKLESRFPLVSGTVIDHAGEDAVIDVGYEVGVRSGTRFVAIADADDGGAGEGQVCRVDGEWVELDVKQVSRESSKARIVPAEGAGTIRKGCRLYAR